MKLCQRTLHTDKSIKPIKTVRHNPFHLRKDIDKQIKLLLGQDIIKETNGEHTEWLSETVNVPICIDMKAANTAIRSEQFEMPNIENLIYKANGMNFFN
jgi:hypothetical protein